MKFHYSHRHGRFAYTLIELMIAMTISLFLLLGVVTMFRDVGKSINDTQSTLLMSSSLSGAGLKLRSDLAEIPASLAKKVTLYGTGTEAPDSDGYLEIIEGMNAPPVWDTAGKIHKDGLHVPSEDIFLSNDASTPNTPDLTVGDVDDILMFTARAKNGAYPYRGLIGGDVQTSNYAEIAWFVRGNTLYRRQLLVDDGSLTNLATNPNYQDYDLSFRQDGANRRPNTLTNLADRRNRFARTTNASLHFPYPLYLKDGTTDTSGWYYLRLPTLEETVSSAWTTGPLRGTPATILPDRSGTDITSVSWDLWEKPYNSMSDIGPTGSLTAYPPPAGVSRAGEDIILTNVLSFDVKVWNPYWVPCENSSPGPNASNAAWLWAPPQFVDLGQDRFLLRAQNGDNVPCKVNYLQNVTTNYPAELADHASATSHQKLGYGFTLKGRYNSNNTTNNRLPSASPELAKEQMSDSGGNKNYWYAAGFGATPQTTLPCVYDSWTDRYEKENVRGTGVSTTSTPNHDDWTCPPPYDDAIQAIQVTICCFDPASKNIRQFRIVHTF